MSEWYEAEPENIDISFSEKEFDILVHTNDCGNVYLTIPFKILESMYEEMTKQEER